MPRKNPPTGDPILDALRAERERRGWSQTELAEAIGRGTYNTAYQWESGVCSPTLRSLREWAAALGYDVTLTPLAAEQPEPAPEQANARVVARELLRLMAEAIRLDVASSDDEDLDRLMLAEIFEAARPLVGNPQARPLVLPVAKLAQRMYAAATAEQPNVHLDDRLDTRDRCPVCSRPVTRINDQGDGPVARQYLPCGCTRIVPTGGDRD